MMPRLYVAVVCDLKWSQMRDLRSPSPTYRVGASLSMLIWRVLMSSSCVHLLAESGLDDGTRTRNRLVHNQEL